ncbi:MAG: hypothetical protein M2R45_03891 [Verrucomicrobia subdivision 3 bacterium]|nr:hypothetical protein [Limisphaerales bacterium]MCS1412594.1 hypothetical protein [Limisphaerales bacterium]
MGTIRPQEEIDFLTQRMREDIQRNRLLLGAAALAEFPTALESYGGLTPR